VRNDDPRIVRALERFEEFARDPRTRERLQDVAANSPNKRHRAQAQRILKRLDAELG
jgi:hypothetical protein